MNYGFRQICRLKNNFCSFERFQKIMHLSTGKVVVHSIPPYAMAWTSQNICVAGPDKKVVFYTPEGLLAQQFDYFR